MSTITDTAVEPIITADEVALIAAVRPILKRIAVRAQNRAFANTESGNYHAYSLGKLTQLLDCAGDGIFDVLNHAHNGHDVPVTDDQMFAR